MKNVKFIKYEKMKDELEGKEGARSFWLGHYLELSLVSY